MVVFCWFLAEICVTDLKKYPKNHDQDMFLCIHVRMYDMKMYLLFYRNNSVCLFVIQNILSTFKVLFCG